MRRTSGCLPTAMLPRKTAAVRPSNTRGFPLNEALIVQQQRRRAQHQHGAGGNDVHGLEAAGAQPVDHQLQHAGDHQRGRGPVNVADFKDRKEDDERRPFEELIHARIIAEAMSIYLQLHPVTPQRRYRSPSGRSAARAAAVIVYPTDSCYALGCHIGDKAALGTHPRHSRNRPQSSFHAGVPGSGGRRQIRCWSTTGSTDCCARIRRGRIRFCSRLRAKRRAV